MAELYRDNRTFFGVEDDTWIALAIWSILCYLGLVNSVNGVLNRFLENPISYDTIAIAVVTSIFIVLGVMASIKRMERRVFLLILAVAFLWILSFIINEHARVVLKRYYFTTIMVNGLVGILCIGHFNNWKRFQQVGKYFIFIGIVLFCILSVFIIDGTAEQLYMTVSYNNMIFVIGAFWLAIRGKNKLMWIFAPIGLIFLIIVGCRGAVLCVITYVVLEFLLNKKIHIALKVLFLAAVVLIYCNLENIMLQINAIVSGFGYESRTLNKFFEGALQEDSGRGNYYSAAVEVINKFAVFGCGMGGSSFHLYEEIHGVQPNYVQYIYSHNIILDMLMEYGVIFGLIIMFWIVISSVTAYFKARKTGTGGDGILFILISISICKLMLSGTYLSEPPFFILLGLLVNLNCYSNYIPWDSPGGGD